MSPPDGTPVTIPVEDVELEGNLLSTDEAAGVVVFAHGSGSSRHSPRNAFVAEILQERGLGALLFDLLTEAEDRDRTARFDIERLTDRLLAATVWLREFEVGADRPIGYFGSSTGAAAALLAAADRPGPVLPTTRSDSRTAPRWQAEFGSRCC